MRKRKNHKPLSAEQRAERREDDRRRMRDAIEQLKDSEGWKRWLRVRVAFHCYSFRNQLLIALQCPDATHVAGYRAWQKIGYQVRRGEKGIYIWARCKPSRKKVERWRKEGADPDREPRPFYKMVKVFDRSQVDPIPDFPGGALELVDPAREPIGGDGLAYLFQPLAAFAAEFDYRITVTSLRGEVEAFCGHVEKVIGVQPISGERSPNQQIADLLHELAHMLIKVEPPEEDIDIGHDQEEVVVECVATLVCAGVGLDVTDHSAPYIAGWGEAEQIERYGEEIDRLASRIEDVIRAAAEGKPEAPAPVEPALQLVA